ncbi:MAG: transposase [Actinobacteria bacterium]|nr:transposase [Actinomycetota bacterium]
MITRIAPFASAGTTGRPPYPVLVLLRVQFLQQWFSLADEAARGVLHDIPVYRAFAGIDSRANGIPDATAILRVRLLLGRHGLAVALEEVDALFGVTVLGGRSGTRTR